MTKVIPFRALTTPPPRIFFWVTLPIAEADAIVANGAKTFLAKGTAISINGSTNFPNKVTRNPPN